MTVHDDLYQASASPVLDDHHGEPAMLTASGGSAVAITARVNRAGLEGNFEGEDTQGSRRAVIVVTIKRSDLPTLTLGKDRIAVAERKGGPVKDYILETLINDAGDEWVVSVN